jgi:hypothetical protein
VLGKGRPLFADKVASMDMNLLAANKTDLGAVSLIYVQGHAKSADAARRRA